MIANGQRPTDRLRFRSSSTLVGCPARRGGRRLWWTRRRPDACASAANVACYRLAAGDTLWSIRRTCVEIKILPRGFHSVHAIDATPARWRGDAFSPRPVRAVGRIELVKIFVAAQRRTDTSRCTRRRAARRRASRPWRRSACTARLEEALGEVRPVLGDLAAP